MIREENFVEIKQEMIDIKTEVTEYSPERSSNNKEEEFNKIKTEINDENDQETGNPSDDSSNESKERGAAAEQNVVPERSKERYNLVYKNFMEWKEQQKCDNSFSESLLLAYFEEKSNVWKPSTLWAHYSMLRSMMNIYQNVDMRSYKNLIGFLKTKSKGFESTKSKGFTPQNIEKFLREAPDNQYLAAKVILIFGVTGSCQASEMKDIQVEDVEIHDNFSVVKIRRTKSGVPRSFTITGNFLDFVKRYAALRPKNSNTNRFFNNYQNGKCTVQVIGINKISKTPEMIAKYLKLENPHSYTGHTFRRTIATNLSASKRHEQEGFLEITREKIDIKSEVIEYSSESDVDQKKGEFNKSKTEIADEDDLEPANPTHSDDPFNELREKGAAAEQNVIPERSKERYNLVYKNFMEWKEQQKCDNFFSESLLLAYFKEKSNVWKPSTLWSHYSMLRSMMNMHQNVDMSSYRKLINFLKTKSKGYESKKSKGFTPEDIDKFLREAPDNQYLAAKVILIFGLTGCCRSSEMKDINLEDVEIHDNISLVKIRRTKSGVPRSFTITGKFLDFVKRYVALRPKNIDTNSFFINYKDGKCTTQPVGINKMSRTSEMIAKYLKLENPHLYTGHALRRASATDLTAISGHGDWKSDTVAGGYTEDSPNSKNKIADNIASLPSSSADSVEVKRIKISTNKDINTQINTQFENISNRIIEIPASTISVQLTNCSNCVVKFI